jgi:hypothetical protein
VRRKRARSGTGARGASRPEGIPEDATYDARRETWCSGPLEAGKRSGPWVFTYSDGTLAGRASYQNGVLEGPAEWFHRSGDLRERVTYAAGKVHGKQVWQRTKKGKTPGFEWFDKLGSNVWRYEVARAHGAGEARYFTLYGKPGMDEQVPTTPEGRSIELGEHMEKLEPQTVLMLVEECFIDDDEEEVHAGSLARLARGVSTAKGRYIYVGKEMDDLYRLRFAYDDGSDPDEFFVDPTELSRAFTLAADYFLTARALLERKKA